MAKIENTLRILFLLRQYKKIKMNEMANILDISPRMVRRHVNILRNMGYDIAGKAGRYSAGYILHEINLTSDEWNFLYRIEETLTEKEKKSFIRILNKINFRLNKSF